MNILQISIVSIFCMAGCASAGAASNNANMATVEVAAYAPMEIFAPLAGRTFQGEGTGPGGEPITDIVTYEFILGGRAFQATHKLKDSTYGGRTIFFYDEGAKEYVFHYFTTAGFHTTGNVEPTGKGFMASETVNGHDTIVKVQSEVIIENDAIRVSANYIDKDGNTAKGGERIYQPTDNIVLFFDEADAVVIEALE